MAQFYSDDYRPHRAVRERRNRSRPDLPRWLVGQSRQVVANGKGRLLDFGCGGGSFLTQMRQLGWHVTGVDICAEAVRHLRDKRSVEAFAGSLPHPDLPADSFDVLTMWQSLEHVHQPRQVLEAALGLLKPGGKLLVAVPNIDSLPYRWFGPNWYGLDLPRHLLHFTPPTLRDMLQSCGFALTEMHMVARSSWLRWSARRAGKRFYQNKTISRLVTWHHRWLGEADGLVATAIKP